jgi:flagellar biosynthesis protein FlhF
MKIKRYFASDIRTAIRRVRDEQGPDAVILSNRAVDGGVEIVAAVDYDNLLSDIGANQATGPSVAETKPAATARTTPEEDAVARMGRELTSLRGMLEHQLSGLAWGELGRKHPQRMLLVRRLRELGLSAALAQKIGNEIPEQADMERVWRQALALLAHYLPVTNDDILARGGVVALVGPTGVGKTTTLAKLAARCMLRHGPSSVALITADDQRIGAHDQLRIYGQILNIPVRIARDHAGLQDALAELRTHKLILVDTAGLSQRDPRLTEQLSRLRSASPLLRCYLTLAANSQIASLEEAVGAFAAAQPAGVILTKIDEAASLGGALTVLSARGLPAAYVSEGQRVPEDLAPARSHTLVSRCVAIAQRTRDAQHTGASRPKVA